MNNQGGIFTSVVKKHQKRSSFNLSHDVKLSLDMGTLVPTLVQEVVPGDSFTIRTSSMLRLAPLIAPVMHKINVYQEFFFVPNRILWSNWEVFITGARNGKLLSHEDNVLFPIVQPYLSDSEGNAVNMQNGTSSLLDYLGLPTRDQFPYPGPGNPDPMVTGLFVNALPFAAYQRIWDEYYRDENLQESMYDVDDFENYNQLYDGAQPQDIQQQLSQIRPRAWEHDYFTSALPWAQKGEQVSIPVQLQPKRNSSGTTYNAARVYPSADGNTWANTPQPLTLEVTNPNDNSLKAPGGQVSNPALGNSVTIMQEMTNHSTINDLRAAIKLQEWLETNARGGSRYFESIYAHFGVKSPDSRLQRPEFIGSFRTNMIISEVLQTSSPQDETDTPQGNMSGHAQAVGSSRKFKYYAQEHGFIIGLISVLPSTAYQQGIPKLWNKTGDRLDYYFPEFAHLGEQEILNKEIYAGAEFNVGEDFTYDPNGTFGYTPRYAEYKFQQSRAAGDFRDTLDFWHMARIFENGPNLNDFFISSSSVTKRIFAVQDIPQDGTEGGSIRDFDSIYAHVFFDIKATRLMPKYGTPKL